jgi:KDO2-lipid IV(A) lauroyltransferase
VDKQARFRLEERAAGLTEALVRRLPLRVAAGLGGMLGRLWAELDRRHVAIAVDNMRHAFPEWEEVRLQRTARGVYTHFGKVLFEMLWLRGRSPEQIRDLFDVVGHEHAAAAVDAGRGVVYPTAHVGNWEMTALAHSLSVRPFGVVARHLDNPALETRLRQLREQTGNTVIYKKKALSQILKILRGGGGVGILVDQNVQEKDGIFVDFFGRPACATTVTAALAVKTGCALVYGHTRRLADGRYQLIYEPGPSCSPSGDRQRDIAWLTQQIAHRTEDWVREVPEQWLWMHRRWHTQPRPGAGLDPALQGFERPRDLDRPGDVSPTRGDG